MQLAAFALEDLIWLVARHHQSLMTCPPLPHTHHSLLGDQERAERERQRERESGRVMEKWKERYNQQMCYGCINNCALKNCLAEHKSLTGEMAGEKGNLAKQ